MPATMHGKRWHVANVNETARASRGGGQQPAGHARSHEGATKHCLSQSVRAVTASSSLVADLACFAMNYMSRHPKP